MDYYKTNIAVIGSRNSGKTTFLKNIYEHYKYNSYTIIIIDSTTDHLDKSLIKYLEKCVDDIQIIDSPDKKDVIRYNKAYNLEKTYPYSLLKEKTYQTICFDVSKYLEEGYTTDDLVIRNHIRMYYKFLVVQYLKIIYSLYYNNKVIILMDEIEFLPSMGKLIFNFNSKNIFLVVALHDTLTLGNCKNLFKIINLDSI